MVDKVEESNKFLAKHPEYFITTHNQQIMRAFLDGAGLDLAESPWR